MVLLALAGDPAEPGETDHVAGCAGCRTELESLRHIAGLGAEAPGLSDLPAPPERIWQAIETGIVRRPGKKRRRPALVLVAVVVAVLLIAGGAVLDRFTGADRTGEV